VLSLPAPETGCAMRCRTRYIRRDARGHYKGQKQIWYLLAACRPRLGPELARRPTIPSSTLGAGTRYWIPLDAVVEFKRDVYQLALTELARYLPRQEPRSRYLRAGARSREADAALTRTDVCGSASARHCAAQLPPARLIQPKHLAGGSAHDHQVVSVHHLWFRDVT